MFQRILICTSLSDGLQRLIGFGPSLAAAGVEQITFLHVVPLEGRGVPKANEEKVRQAKAQLTEAQVDLPANLQIKVEVQAGLAPERILAVAQAEQADLVILGTESRSLLTERLFGSTAVSLCQSGKLPVLILRPQMISTYTVEELDLRCRHLFRSLLIPYDGSKTADYLLSQIKQRVARPQALRDCLLLHVVESGGVDKMLHDSRMQAAQASMATAEASLAPLNLKVTSRIEAGDRMAVTLRMAMDYDISAIAIATARLGKLAELSSPSFTGELLRRSWHPVLFFPAA